MDPELFRPNEYSLESPELCIFCHKPAEATVFFLGPCNIDTSTAPVLSAELAFNLAFGDLEEHCFSEFEIYESL